jgi:hypothetical protein
MAESIDLLKNDLRDACMALQASKFHNRGDFTCGNFTWLLDPFKRDRIPTFAQQWRDRPDAEKLDGARELASRLDPNAVPHWRNPDDILTEARISMLSNLFRKRIARQGVEGIISDPELPDLDYLQKYFVCVLPDN